MSGNVTPSPLEARRHIPALDGVRGIAALLVMFFHFGRPEVAGTGGRAVGFFTQFGWGGVDLFFVLSGFLIGGILLDTRDRPRFLRTFYKRRALRIFPLYFAFIAAYLFVIVPLLPGPAADVASRQTWLWTYLSNFDVAAHGWYSGVGSHANGLWSLAIEEQFYLIAPFLVLVLSRRGLVAAATIGIAGSLAARFALEVAGYPARVAYVVTFARVDALSIGVLLAILARKPEALDRAGVAARVLLPLSLVMVFAYARLHGSFENEDWTTLKYALPVFTVACASLLVLAVAPTGLPPLRALFESRPLRWLGLYSYSLYIWHPLVGRLVRLAGFTQAGVLAMTGSSAVAVVAAILVKGAAAIVVAVASYHIIELPFLKLKDPQPRAAGRQVAPASAPV